MSRILSAFSFVAVSALLATPAAAQTGHPTAPTGHATARDGDLMLATALLPMSGPEFQTLWNTPSETVPQLPAMSAAAEGQVITFVAFVAGMALQADGSPDLECHVAFAQRTGEGQVAFDGPCLQGVLQGPASDQYAAVIFDFRVPVGFAGEIVVLDARVSDRLGDRQARTQIAMPVVLGANP